MTTRRFDTTWGAIRQGDAVRFRLWAPGLDTLALRLGERELPMSTAGDGWFEAVEPASPGTPYGFVLPDGMFVPDPAARAQAGDVHGPSLVVEPASYDWTVASPARPWAEAVIHEIHVGTFTEEGTFAAAAARMPYLADLGITAVELMPVAQFEGARGWGYDGVLLYAPHSAYGTPDDMKRLVEAAHEAGLMVLLDVVYNHFGPEGNYLSSFALDFYGHGRNTPWGDAIDFTSAAVRRFYADNALFWLLEYDLDGLRLDAIDHIHDPSDPDVLVEIARRVREARGDRPTWLTTEDNRNITRLHERAPDGSTPLYDGEWNDDLHNAVHVVATGETEGYYGGFAHDPWGLYARALAEGFAYQGETEPGAQEGRGEPSAHLPPLAFVDFLQNHDQVGNRAMGERLIALTSQPMLDALQAIHLLSPHVPLMFMGEEYGETEPFFFFTDFHDELADAVREGRRGEFASFRMFADPEDRKAIPDPNALTTFLDFQAELARGRRRGGAGRARARADAVAPETRARRAAPGAGGRPCGDGGRGRAGRGVDRLAPRRRAVAAARQSGRCASIGPEGHGRAGVRPGTRRRRRARALRRGVLPRSSGRRVVNLRALARQNGIATSHGGRPVPDETLRLILTQLGAEGEGVACHLPGWLREAPAWGVFCQLYELRPASKRSDWGIGDLADLADLACVLGAAGADFLGVNPLHAMFLGDPSRRSPFSPSDRRFLNPLYIAADGLPGAAAAKVTAPAPTGDLIDHAAVASLKLGALRAIFDAIPFGDEAWSRHAFEAFEAEGGEALARHATFEALSLRMAGQGHGAGWHGWPEAFRDAGSKAVRDFRDSDAGEIRFHMWLQWATSVQLEAAARAAREAGMRIGLYLDLAVGEAPDGAASWGSEVIMGGLSIGAPPDMFAAHGQDWGLAAPNPRALAHDPAPFREMIAAQLRHAGALRIDHAMALRQLFLIPKGQPPSEGAYVRYPTDSLLSVLAEETRRAEAVVIGEDLGSVPEGFSDEMRSAGILSYRILWFEQQAGAFRPPAEWPEIALACLSTHDLPTLESWWAAEDVALRREHGLVSEEASAEHAEQRAHERHALLALLREEGLGEPGWAADGPLPEGLLVALHLLLARTPSLLTAVRLADLVGPARPTNLPGTLDAYPNWRPRSPTRVDRIAESPEFCAVTAAMAEARPRRTAP